MGNHQDIDHDASASVDSASPGQRLRQAREARQLTCDAVAAQMRIEAKVIDALERDDYTQLPAAVFVRGYLRSYAKLVGLAAEPIVEAFDQRTTNAPPPLVLPSRIGADIEPHTGYARWVVLALAMVSLLLFYLWWHQDGGKPVPVAAPPPVALPQPKAPTHSSDTFIQSPVVVPSSEPGTRLENRNETPAGESGPGEVTAQPATTSLASMSTARAAADPVPPVATTDSGSVPPSSATESKPQITPDSAAGPLVLRFTADCWVVIRDAGGRALLQGLIRSGQRRVLDGKAPFQVTLGNAPAVEIEYLGQRFDQSRYTGPSRTARFTLGK